MPSVVAFTSLRLAVTLLLPAATSGNRLELAGPLLMSLALAAPVLIFHAYYLRLQTYVCVHSVVVPLMEVMDADSGCGSCVY